MSDQALLVMDFQPVILGSVGGDDSPALAAAKTAVDVAHKHNIPVIFVRVAFRRGYPEINPANKGFAPLANYGDVFVETEPTAQIHPALAPTSNDFIVTKRRMSAFSGSDLSAILGGLGSTHLVLAGLSTSGVVLSTLRHAADADFELTVLTDACADPDEQVHTILTGKIFPTHAATTTTKEWADTL